MEYIDLPLGSRSKPSKEPMSAFKAGYTTARLEEGKLGLFETVENKAIERSVQQSEIYKTYQKELDAYADIGEHSLAAKDIRRLGYESLLKNDVFRLDANDNVVEGSGHFIGASLLYDTDAIKGFLLANKYGLSSKDNIKKHYQDIVKETQTEVSTAEDGAVMNVLGAITGYLAGEETATDFASPAKIMGSTIVGGALKATATEAGYIALGETAREAKRRKHAEYMDEDRTLWDGVQDILINSGFGGAIRGIGSSIVDARTMQKIHNRIPDKDSKAIFARYAQRENFKLTKHSGKHQAVMNKAEQQLEKGTKVDVAQHLDKDMPLEKETINIFDEAKNDIDFQKDLKTTDEIFESVDNALNEDDPYFIDEDLLKRFSEHEELKDEYKELFDTGSDEFGKKIEEAEASVKKPKGFQPKVMTYGDTAINKTDFDNIQKYQKIRKWNLENPTKKKSIPKNIQESYENYKDIADDLLDLDFQENVKVPIFSQFADNLAVGTVAGIEQNEDGTWTFNPDMFVAGLGGYTAVKAMAKRGYFDNLPDEINAQIKKHFGVDLDSGIVERQPGEKLLDYKKRVTKDKIDSGEIPEKGQLLRHPRSTNGYYLGNSGKVYFNARGKWIEMPNQEVIDEVNEIANIGYNKFIQKEKMADEEFAKAIAESEAKEKAKLESPDFYKDAHTAPTRDRDSNTSIDDLLKIYPDDIYRGNAARYYGDGDVAQDRVSIKILQRVKDNPNATVTIYRAIPKDIEADINIGDWVTINKQYAREHGENRFDGKYKILSKDVKAKDIITDGNSIHEQGYDPIKETK